MYIPDDGVSRDQSVIGPGVFIFGQSYIAIIKFNRNGRIYLLKFQVFPLCESISSLAYVTTPLTGPYTPQRSLNSIFHIRGIHNLRIRVISIIKVTHLLPRTKCNHPRPPLIISLSREVSRGSATNRSPIVNNQYESPYEENCYTGLQKLRILPPFLHSIQKKWAGA